MDSAMTPTAEEVARCVKCGRGFITMPSDGRDHYDWRSGYRGRPQRRWNEPLEECGGEVVALDTLRSQRKE